LLYFRPLAQATAGNFSVAVTGTKVLHPPAIDQSTWNPASTAVPANAQGTQQSASAGRQLPSLLPMPSNHNNVIKNRQPAAKTVPAAVNGHNNRQASGDEVIDLSSPPSSPNTNVTPTYNMNIITLEQIPEVHLTLGDGYSVQKILLGGKMVESINKDLGCDTPLLIRVKEIVEKFFANANEAALEKALVALGATLYRLNRYVFHSVYLFRISLSLYDLYICF
jgi:hypothetical protein